MATVLEYLIGLRPAIPMSVERPCTLMGGPELRRHMAQRGLLINGETVTPTEPMDFPVHTLVFFPNSKTRRTTLV